MVFMAVIMVLGLLFFILLRLRHTLQRFRAAGSEGFGFRAEGFPRGSYVASFWVGPRIKKKHA